VGVETDAALPGKTIPVHGSLHAGCYDDRFRHLQDGGGSTVTITPEQFEAIGEKLGLHRPLVVQYFMWLGRTLKGDLGKTLVDERPVTTIIREKLPNTLQLSLGGAIFAIALGLPLGVLSAVRRGTFWDYFGRMLAILGMGTPQFWASIMLILLLAVYLDWLPAGTRGISGAPPFSWANIKYFILPAIMLGWHPTAGFLRITRSAMLEVLDSEYIKFARVKGVREWKVIWKHGFKNALIPPLTLIAITLGNFIASAVVVETVFSWPGIGRTAVQSVFNNDFPLLTAVVLLFAGVYVFLNFLADVAYAYLDPRIRYS